MNACLRQSIWISEVRCMAAPRMSQKLERLLGKVEADIRRGRNLSWPISIAEELEWSLPRLPEHQHRR